MERDKVLTEEIVDFSKKIGIDVIGFGDPIHFERFPKINRPNNYHENARTVIIIGLIVRDIILDAWTTDDKFGINFHFLDSILENRLFSIKDYLLERGFKSKIIPYKPGLFLKDAGAIAGIGPIGKHNLLISNEVGSQIRLRALVTEAFLETGNPITESEYCKDCEICIKVCPANAIKRDGYDRQSCLDYNLSNLKKLSKNTVIWCNICLDACPIQN
ncbi:MAG: epoxyqueuosine reductase [Candidatus Lokiarchaeota archaeon]|nr:epoxyqueuosine reductase [Candidatus Lokiarchaeota archaeon]